MKILPNKFGGGFRKDGSALIMTVVLTVLLAVIGALFLMMSRVDNIATSAISRNRQLDGAVESAVEQICQVLAEDLPPRGEYYDYPGSRDAWLANLEPVREGNDYMWQHISDVTGAISAMRAAGCRDSDGDIVSADNLRIRIVEDYPAAAGEGDKADADGDGVADSRWVVLGGVKGSKGEDVYTAVRIIDNGGMINVNTGFMFDSNSSDVNEIDGSSLTQINLAGLAERGANGVPVTAAARLLNWRCGDEPNDLRRYERDVIWQYGDPNGEYLPFDISDELKLRNRYILNYNQIVTRIEELWERAFDGGLLVQRTKESDLINDPNYWYWHVTYVPSEPNVYDYRHIATVYSIDRVINPYGGKMWNLNRTDVNSLYGFLRIALSDVNTFDPNIAAGQLAANIVDWRDADPNITVFSPNDGSGRVYYGFEAQPFISEAGFKINSVDPVSGTNYFAVELCNPFNVAVPLDRFRLELREHGNPAILAGTIVFGPNDVIAGMSRFVITSGPGKEGEPSATGIFGLIGADPNTILEDPALKLAVYRSERPTFIATNYDMRLVSRVAGLDLGVDVQATDPDWFLFSLAGDGNKHFYRRDDSNWNIVYQQMGSNPVGTLGMANGGAGAGTNWNLERRRGPFVTVGDIGRVLRVGHGYDASPGTNVTLGNALAQTGLTEGDIRLNLQRPEVNRIFQYLTVIDPDYDGIDNDGDEVRDQDANEYSINWPPEWKIKGRININTAPWFVLSQLPWVSDELAQAIVAYRDKRSVWGGVNVSYEDPNGNPTGRYSATGINGVREERGFESIGELINVVNGSGQDEYSIAYYGLDGFDLAGFPDLSGGDGKQDDFEERDVIFSRVSNLVTVRSDVFTAYILVRLGATGPQKRMLAVLDRSDAYHTYDRVRVLTLHQVADPR
ncbi:MAG: helix-hairpin-helix domain-containing protein [Planctomycetota bacterium]